MRHMHRWDLHVLAITLLLATSVGAGTKPANSPPAAKTPVEQFMLKVRELDPNGLLILSAKIGKEPSELWVAMSQMYHAAHYQQRLQLAQAMGGAWRTISGHSDGVVFVTDRTGNMVGSSFLGNTSVQRY